MIFTLPFWKGAAERGIKTFLQTFVAVITLTVGSDAIGSTATLGAVPWMSAVSIAALATVLSMATSVGNATFTAGETGPAVEPAHSLTDDEPLRH